MLQTSNTVMENRLFRLTRYSFNGIERSNEQDFYIIIIKFSSRTFAHSCQIITQKKQKHRFENTLKKILILKNEDNIPRLET